MGHKTTHVLRTLVVFLDGTSLLFCVEGHLGL